MNNIKLFIELLLIFIFIQKSLSESGEDDVYYIADFNDEIKDCEGFENNIFKCTSLKVGIINGNTDGEDKLGLSGKLEVLAEITDEYSVDLKVWKETDLAKEFMYTISGNLCASLKRKDTPWLPLVQSLNATECPIEMNDYPVNDMVMSLEFAKNVLRHEFVGDYEIEFSIIDLTENKLSCHIISVGISEKTKG